MFHKAMKSKGLSVQRSTIPLSIELSDKESELQDPNAYPVKVSLQIRPCAVYSMNHPTR